jgi:hypothetical protein
MAGDFIKIDPGVSTQKFAGDLMQFISQVRTTLQQGDALKSRMERMHDGADFTAIETLFGLPSGTGQTVFDLVNGTIGAMRGVFQNEQAVEITSRLG